SALGFPSDQIGRLHAIVLSRVGRYAEAEPILLGALAETREPDPEVEEALARVYLETYRLKQAEQVIRRWMIDAPADATPYLWLTEIDRRTSVDAVSVQLKNFHAALRRNPNLDQARLGLADALRASQRTAEAAEEYARYLARKPEDPAGLIGAGRTALDQGDEKAAAAFLDRSLAHAPDNPLALRLRAQIDLHEGELQTALARLNKAHAADPFDAEALHTRSLVLSGLGRIEQCKADQQRRDQLRADQARLLRVRDKLVGDVENNDLRCEVAAWMFEHGRPEEGLRWAKHVLAVSPTHRAANRLLADYYDHRGDAGLANFYRMRAEDGQP
ncbi:MAG TPA: tetratricopeptide repeat protein, partial [Isosphaeraceae bacterium]|nr:tetratricopeptide repeat protein [Isosphaeraceae bacterium]